MGGAAAAERLTVRPLRVLRDAVRVYREHWAGLLGGAFLVFLPLSFVDAWLGSHEAESPSERALEAMGESALHLFGDVFYAGLVAAAVIAWRGGMRRERAIDVARALPWPTIVALDLIVTFGAVLLAVPLIVPGIVFYVYASLAASVAKIEHIGVRVALRRSFRMVRGSWWRVFAVLAIVQVGSGVVEGVLQEVFEHFAADVLVHAIAESVTAPVYGLAAVLMAFGLGARSDHQPGA